MLFTKYSKVMSKTGARKKKLKSRDIIFARFWRWIPQCKLSSKLCCIPDLSVEEIRERTLELFLGKLLVWSGSPLPSSTMVNCDGWVGFELTTPALQLRTLNCYTKAPLSWNQTAKIFWQLDRTGSKRAGIMRCRDSETHSLKGKRHLSDKRLNRAC